MWEIQFTEITTCQNQSQSLLHSFDPSFLCSITPFRSFAPSLLRSFNRMLHWIIAMLSSSQHCTPIVANFHYPVKFPYPAHGTICSKRDDENRKDRRPVFQQFIHITLRSILQSTRIRVVNSELTQRMKCFFIYLTLETTPHVTNRHPMQSIHSDATYPFTLWGPLHNHSTCSRMTNVSTNLEDPYLQIIHVLWWPGYHLT